MHGAKEGDREGYRVREREGKRELDGKREGKKDRERDTYNLEREDKAWVKAKIGRMRDGLS